MSCARDTRLFSRPAILIATGAYVGMIPFAPGTAGSALGVLVVVLLQLTGMPPAPWLALLLGLTVAGVWAGGEAERHFARPDPGPVVIDEIVGTLITLAFVPLTATTALAGFVLFRVADIIKPYPAGRLEKLPGGWGIMADDVVAALYAHVALRGLIAAIPAWLT